MISPVRINHRLIGAGHPAYVIAELSANHGHDFAMAVELVRAAHRAGADAVKLQTYTPDSMTIDSDRPEFRSKGTIWDGRSLYDLYGEGSMPWEWQPKLKAVADDLGIALFSSPFDATAVDFLQEMAVPAYKIASYEVIDLPLIRKVAAIGMPIIISTGAATISEIEEAITTARAAGAQDIVLLKCTSAYPAPPEEMNLATIPHMAAAFGVPVGLSDHSLGIAAPIAAVALGACVIEKHFTLSRATPGPDSSFSLEPDEFRLMVEGIRVAEKAVGTVHYGGTTRENRDRRRSLFVVQDMAAGEVFTKENVRSIRPGHGLHTRHLETVLGRKATRVVPRGTPMSWDLIG